MKVRYSLTAVSENTMYLLILLPLLLDLKLTENYIISYMEK